MKSIHIGLPLVMLGLALLLSSCQTGRSNYMSEKQRNNLETAYDSLQTTYQTLMADYKSSPDTLPVELKNLYSQMQKMHQQMQASQQRMMSGNMGGHMQGGHMMGNGMTMHRQGHMTGEWYSQMISMHEQMARMHQRMGQQSMAQMNRHLSDEFGKMQKMLPGLDKPADGSFDEEEMASSLDKATLYSQNCASCHGSDAQGMAGIFPPLVNSEWVTGDKSIPIRILLNGLQGNVTVQGQTYQGIMPSFKARLGATEIAGILTYLREKSNGDLPPISRQDVIQVRQTFSKRTAPWSAAELNKN